MEVQMVEDPLNEYFKCNELTKVVNLKTSNFNCFLTKAFAPKFFVLFCINVNDIINSNNVECFEISR